MNAYELMVKTNHYLIKGGLLTDNQKQNIVHQFLSAINRSNFAKSFEQDMKDLNHIDKQGRRMYPLFFVPPYNAGKKFKTILYQAPQTQILSSNSYELEILRLLYKLDPHNQFIIDMVTRTLIRLKTTCFGNKDDGVGECFDASNIVLRFLASVNQSDTTWMKERIINYRKHYSEKHRHAVVQWYFWLCLSELPDDIATSEILKDKDDMLKQIHRSYRMHKEKDNVIYPVILCIIRNCLARLEEFDDIKDRLPYINEGDGRLYFSMTN